MCLKLFLRLEYEFDDCTLTYPELVISKNSAAKIEMYLMAHKYLGYKQNKLRERIWLINRQRREGDFCRNF